MAIPHIYFKDYGKAKIFCPTIEEQSIIAKSLSVIEKKDQQIPSIIRLIRNSKSLFGCEEVTEEQRNLLISRVTSFETIENNY